MIDKAHKSINGKLRLRLSRLEEENKQLKDTNEDNLAIYKAVLLSISP